MVRLGKKQNLSPAGCRRKCREDLAPAHSVSTREAKGRGLTCALAWINGLSR